MEYNICIAVVALTVAAIGPGRFALDRPFRWGDGGWRAAGVALLLGGLGSAAALLI
jgi:putative oxidoreductase